MVPYWLLQDNSMPQPHLQLKKYGYCANYSNVRRPKVSKILKDHL